MGYQHIENLYKNQTIFLFKECYALEKIHGTSAHIKWSYENQKLTFFSGGEDYYKFVSLFNEQELTEKFIKRYEEHNSRSDITFNNNRRQKRAID